MNGWLAEEEAWLEQHGFDPPAIDELRRIPWGGRGPDPLASTRQPNGLQLDRRPVVAHACGGRRQPRAQRMMRRGPPSDDADGNPAPEPSVAQDRRRPALTITLELEEAPRWRIDADTLEDEGRLRLWLRRTAYLRSLGELFEGSL